MIADATAIFVPPALAAEAILDVFPFLSFIDCRPLLLKFLLSLLLQKEFLNMIWLALQLFLEHKTKLVSSGLIVLESLPQNNARFSKWLAPADDRSGLCHHTSIKKDEWELFQGQEH
jgi:hypothetical protein